MKEYNPKVRASEMLEGVFHGVVYFSAEEEAVVWSALAGFYEHPSQEKAWHDQKEADKEAGKLFRLNNPDLFPLT